MIDGVKSGEYGGSEFRESSIEGIWRRDLILSGGEIKPVGTFRSSVEPNASPQKVLWSSTVDSA